MCARIDLLDARERQLQIVEAWLEKKHKVWAAIIGAVLRQTLNEFHPEVKTLFSSWSLRIFPHCTLYIYTWGIGTLLGRLGDDEHRQPHTGESCREPLGSIVQCSWFGGKGRVKGIRSLQETLLCAVRLVCRYYSMCQCPLQFVQSNWVTAGPTQMLDTSMLLVYRKQKGPTPCHIPSFLWLFENIFPPLSNIFKTLSSCRLLHKAVTQGKRALAYALARKYACLNKIDEKDAAKRVGRYVVKVTGHFRSSGKALKALSKRYLRCLTCHWTR